MNPQALAFSCKVAGFFVLLMLFTLARRGRKFPYKTDWMNPFVGAISFEPPLIVTRDGPRVHCAPPSGSKAVFAIFGVAFGPWMTAYFISHPLVLSAMPWYFLYIGAFFCAVGLLLAWRAVAYHPRIEIHTDTGALACFRRPGMGPFLVFRRGEITRFERSKRVYVAESERSRSHPFEAFAAVLSPEETVTLLAADAATAEELSAALALLAPVEVVVPKTAPEDAPDVEGEHLGTRFLVGPAGKRGGDPITRVYFELTEPLARPLGISTHLGAASVAPIDDPRKPEIDELQAMGAHMIDIGRLTTHVAADFLKSRRTIDEPTAKRVVEILIALRDKSR